MTNRSPLQTAALLFGLVYLVVGIAGFIPGITTDYDDLTAFDHEGAKLLGIVGVNVLENIVHLLYGVAGLAVARSWGGSRAYFLGGGFVLLVLWIYGLVIDKDSAANFVGLNAASDWVHFALGATMVALGLLLGRGAQRARRLAA